MGIHVIKMPDIGEGIAEVEIVEWRVKPGDNVVEDQILADVMTDKATVEIPSPVHGTVTALGGTVGQTLPVGAELIRLEIEGAGNVKAEAAAQQVREPAIANVAEQEAATAPAAMVPQPTRNGTPASTPAPARPSRAPAGGAPALRAAGEKPLAAPAVRQRAWDMGIDLKYVGGSGPAGRIMHADLDAYVSGRQHGAHAGADNRYAELSGEEAVPVIGLRRRIAEKMQMAKRQIPHFTYVEEVDVTELEALRAQLNQRYGDERARLTILPLLMRAVVLSVRKFPQVNARFDDEAGIVTRFSPVHIGIATQTDAGLMVPVVRNAEARDPWESALEVARLAEAARHGKALREELSGSTITITSNGGLVARKMMNLSSSFDHRVIDGMDAAEFVQTIRGYLECPATLFVE
jgi:2-oxoisovalerate dehydrogenase E2 component (dihydrolipoyl transacylase)